MKRFRNDLAVNIFAVLAVFLTFSVIKTPAQEDEPEPVKWKLTVEKLTKKLTQDDKFSAILKAQIEKGWHLYALEKIDGGPIPTRISLAPNQPFELGNIISPKPLETDDSAFGVVTKFYENSAEFTLPLQVTEDLETEKLRVKIYYQICNDEICLPPKSVLVESDL